MKKIVFDVDGVILQTPHRRAQILRERFGIELGFEDFYKDKIKEKVASEIKKEMDVILHEEGDIPPYEGVLEIFEDLLERGVEFILLSERRNEAQKNAEISCLKKSGIWDLIGEERIFIVESSSAKIPLIEEFLEGDEGIVIDDGLDKLQKFQGAGIEADFVWFNEFGWEEEMGEGIREIKNRAEFARLFDE